MTPLHRSTVTVRPATSWARNWRCACFLTSPAPSFCGDRENALPTAATSYDHVLVLRTAMSPTGSTLTVGSPSGENHSEPTWLAAS
jgi:hypothetical protein